MNIKITIVDNTEPESPRIVAQWAPVPVTGQGATRLAFAQLATSNAIAVRSYEIFVTALD
jgi:hypothetical protein